MEEKGYTQCKKCGNHHHWKSRCDGSDMEEDADVNDDENDFADLDVSDDDLSDRRGGKMRAINQPVALTEINSTLAHDGDAEPVSNADGKKPLHENGKPSLQYARDKMQSEAEKTIRDHRAHDKSIDLQVSSD